MRRHEAARWFTYTVSADHWQLRGSASVGRDLVALCDLADSHASYRNSVAPALPEVELIPGDVLPGIDPVQRLPSGLNHFSY